MSKRKPPKVAKQPRSKVAVREQRARHAVVRSPKPGQVQLIAAGPDKSLSKLQTEPDAPVLETPTAVLPVVESPAIASQNASQRTTRESNVTKPPDGPPAPDNAGAAQTKQPEMIQAMQLAYEFAHRVAQIKSPFEFPGVLFELTVKQFAMFQDFVFFRQRPR